MGLGVQKQEMANQNPNVSTRYQPGQSGNVAGRPKWSVRSAARDVIGDQVPEGDDLGKLARDLADDLIASARNGDDKRVAVLRGLIAEVEGPHVQEIHAQVEATAKVIIEGWDDEEEKA